MQIIKFMGFTKEHLREVFKAKRQNLAPVQLQTLSQEISNMFFEQFKLSSVKNLHVYMPIAQLNEVNTKFIIDRAKEQFPQINIVSSRIQSDNSSLKHYIIDESCKLTLNDWGIWQPTSGTEVLPEHLDIILVPLLVFDMNGHRVGYGNGFYDRFLSKISTHAIKIGLSFFEPVDEILGIKESDVPLNYCITTDKIYTF